MWGSFSLFKLSWCPQVSRSRCRSNDKVDRLQMNELRASWMSWVSWSSCARQVSQSVSPSVHRNTAGLSFAPADWNWSSPSSPGQIIWSYSRLSLAWVRSAGKGQELAKRCNIAFHYAHNFNYANRTAEQEFRTEIPELHFPHVVEIT